MAKGTTLPVIGTTSAWGGILNRNFTIIESQLKSLYQKVLATSNLIGANIPYVNIDENRYWLELSEGEDSSGIRYITFNYYKKEDKNTVFVEYVYHTTNGWGATGTPSIALASFVINITSVNLDGVDFQKGDILVITPQLGSIYEAETTPITFKKYLPVVDTFVPSMNTISPYKLTFEPTTYADAYSLAQQEFTLPSIGLSNFNYITCSYSGSTYSCTINGGTSTGNIGVENNILKYTFDIASNTQQTVNEFLVNCNNSLVDSSDESKPKSSPLWIWYDTALASTSNANGTIITVTIQWDVSGLASGETLRSDISFSHKGWSEISDA